MRLEQQTDHKNAGFSSEHNLTKIQKDRIINELDQLQQSSGLKAKDV